MNIVRLFATCLSTCTACLVFALPAAHAEDLTTLSVTQAHRDLAAQSSSHFLHARPAQHSSVSPRALELRDVAPAAGPASASAAGPTGNRYPADLTYQGGPVVVSMQSHTIYNNPSAACPAVSCFGDPITFLNDLGHSAFIHIIDQFTGSRAPNRYTVGTNYTATGFLPAGVATDADIQTVVAAAVQYSGEFGYGHEYHVFLAPGQDLCFDASHTVCYSPDNPPTFYFCAYHGSFDLPGYGHVLYSAEPYQNVGGCADTVVTPNGQLTDSTNNVLSHELFETITDPDGNAWWNSSSNPLFGAEIGDECSFITFLPSGGASFYPSVWHANGRTYATQPEYTNIAHTCNTNGEN